MSEIMAPLFKDEENYVRLALLLKGVTPRAVRTYFDREFPPTHLPSTLEKNQPNYNTLFDLKVSRIINQAQWNLLIPINGIPDSKTFDVTLMVCLIRNLTSINPPINGFDTLPLPGETTPGSDLARIKCYRNKLAHHDSNTIDTDYFNTAWTDISNAVGRLGGHNMYQECQELKVKILDQSNQEIVLEIKQSLVEIKELKQTMDNLEKKHSKMTETFGELQSSYNTLQAEHAEIKEILKDPIPPNIKDQFKKQIEYWEKNDKMFVSTRASTYVIKSLEDNSCLTLTAQSGAGKSFIARHTALTLQKAGYKIVPVRQPDDIKNYYQPGEQTVFIIDDICGNFIVKQLEIENWTQHLPVIETVIADKCCKIIVACRLQVYKDAKFRVLTPFKSCECNITSDKLCLTSKEKNSIASKYIDSGMIDIDKLSKNSDFFPLLCSLYNVEKHGDVKEFFKNPFIIYKNELDNLIRHGNEGNYKICSLALLVLFNNKLEENWFQGRITNEQTEIIKDICEACVPKAKLQKELDTLVGTFVSKQDGIYRTIHDKLFDFLTYYFGHTMIQCLIDHGDSRLMQKRFIWDTATNKDTHNIDFIIKIPDGHLESYFQRLIQDWSVGKVRVVFNNTNLQMSSLRRMLLKLLNQLDKTRQLTLANAKETELPNKDCGYDNTPLILSCYHGYTDIVQWLLNNDVDVHQCRDDGVTGLIMASHKGHTDMVKLLLERNTNVDLCTKDGFSPLLQASTNGHTDVVKLLLKRNPDLDVRSNKGKRPLLLASQNGHTDIVKLLLEKDPDVNLCDTNGCSPLLEASQNGHTDVVKLLLEKNTNVHLCSNDGCGPLLQASTNGHTDVVKLLLERNPDIDEPSNKGKRPLLLASQNEHTDIVKLLLEKDPDVNLCDTNGGSPLLEASRNGHTDVVKLLLEKDSDVNLCDTNGCYPLLEASQNGHTRIVELLLERNSDIDKCDRKGCSPLLQADQTGHTDIVKLLLVNNPDVNLCNNNCCIPLLLASQNGHTDIVKLLLEKRPDVNVCDNNGCSPVLMASKNGHTDIVKLLLENNPDVDLCCKDGCSPLYWASYKGHTDILKLLFEKNPDINLSSNNGCSPLYMASQEGHTDIVKSLLETNPDVNLRDNDGFSPLILASQNGHTDTVRLLLGRNPDPCDNTPLSTSSVSNNTSISNSPNLVQSLMKHKPDVNAQTYDGGSALYFGAFHGNLSLTKLLLENNADSNICSYSKQFQTNRIIDNPALTLEHEQRGCFEYLRKNSLSYVADYVSKMSLHYVFDLEADCSPLHIACFMGRTNVVICLLDHNAKINITNEDGITPLFYACEVGHDDTVHVLLDKGADSQILRHDGKSPLNIATDNGHTLITMMITEHTKKETHFNL